MAIISITNETPGAPQITDHAVDDVQRILRFSLPLLGWTIEWDDIPNNKIVFSTEYDNIKHWLRVAEENEDCAVVNAYTDMTDIDTGTNKTSNVWFHTIHINPAESYAPWRITGDSQSFHYLIWPYTAIYNDMTIFHYAGRTHPYYQIDTSTFIVAGFLGNSHLTNIYTNYGVSDTNSSSYISGYIVKSPDNITFNKSIYMSRLSNIHSTADRFNPAIGPHERFGISHVEPKGVIDKDNHFRGYLRGVMTPLGDWVTAYGGREQKQITITMPNGTLKQLELVYVSSRKYGQFNDIMLFFDWSDDWDWF